MTPFFKNPKFKVTIGLLIGSFISLLPYNSMQVFFRLGILTFVVILVIISFDG